jgi:hypothetical protein
MNRNGKQGKEGAQMKRTKNRKKTNHRKTTVKKPKANRKFFVKVELQKAPKK